MTQRRLTVVVSAPDEALLQRAIDALEALEQLPPTTRYAHEGPGVDVTVTITDDPGPEPPAPEPAGVTEVTLPSGARLYLDPASGASFYALWPPPDAVPLLVPAGTPPLLVDPPS